MVAGPAESGADGPPRPSEPLAHPAPLPNLPLTLEEAAWPLFRWSYQTLRANLKTLIAQGMPAVKEGRRYLLYPAHIEAWRAARYPVDARRALRLGGYQCSDAAIQKSGISTTR
jgi:hypothetical protein